MFTGIVEEMGRVAAVARDGEGMRLRIEASLAGELTAGDSVSVSGVCLTAVELGDLPSPPISAPRPSRAAPSDPSPRAISATRTAMRPPTGWEGTSCRATSTAWARWKAVSDGGNARDVRFSAPAGLLRYVVEKGSGTADGVSLTVTGVDDAGFSVSLILETLERTTLAGGPGRPVNLEVDVIAKHVEKLGSDERIPLRNHRGRARGHPRRADGGRLRRRGPRERGDLDARGTVRNAREHQLHGARGAA